MTLEEAIETVGHILEHDYQEPYLDEHKALLVAWRSMTVLKKLKEVIDLCGDLYKTIP